MEGDYECPERCGVIPRTVQTIFDELAAAKASSSIDSFKVKVSYLQLYNEILDDLLADENDPKDLTLFQDARRGLVCQNLEQVEVEKPTEIYALLEEASKKRNVAATNCNELSSRSHALFTITVVTTETTAAQETVTKAGKLNLVDLAGSECVGRSGATGMQVREARNINQSLLTLGCVISALAKGEGHVPYRQSKLTRLLQESLGGKAKTAILACISPSDAALDETISTLTYAFKAKDILNRPVVNAKTTTRGLLQDLNAEIAELKALLRVAYSKDGVHLPLSEYDRLQEGVAEERTRAEELRQELEESIAARAVECARVEADRAGLEAQYAAQVGLLSQREARMAAAQQEARVADEAASTLKTKSAALERRADEARACQSREHATLVSFGQDMSEHVAAMRASLLTCRADEASERDVLVGAVADLAAECSKEHAVLARVVASVCKAAEDATDARASSVDKLLRAALVVETPVATPAGSATEGEASAAEERVASTVQAMVKMLHGERARWGRVEEAVRANHAEREARFVAFAAQQTTALQRVEQSQAALLEGVSAVLDEHKASLAQSLKAESDALLAAHAAEAEVDVESVVEAVGELVRSSFCRQGTQFREGLGTLAGMVATSTETLKESVEREHRSSLSSSLTSCSSSSSSSQQDGNKSVSVAWHAESAEYVRVDGEARKRDQAVLGAAREACSAEVASLVAHTEGLQEQQSASLHAIRRDATAKIARMEERLVAVQQELVQQVSAHAKLEGAGRKTLIEAVEAHEASLQQRCTALRARSYSSSRRGSVPGERIQKMADLAAQFLERSSTQYQVSPAMPPLPRATTSPAVAAGGQEDLPQPSRRASTTREGECEGEGKKGGRAVAASEAASEAATEAVTESMAVATEPQRPVAIDTSACAAEAPACGTGPSTGVALGGSLGGSLDKWTVKMLRKELGARGLDNRGLKAVLVDRLERYSKPAAAGVKPSTPLAERTNSRLC